MYLVASVRQLSWAAITGGGLSLVERIAAAVAGIGNIFCMRVAGVIR